MKIISYLIMVLISIGNPFIPNCFSNAIHWEQEAESKPEVGSSKNITGGLFTNSNAIARRFLCPPLKVEDLVSKHSVKPNVSKIS